MRAGVGLLHGLTGPLQVRDIVGAALAGEFEGTFRRLDDGFERLFLAKTIQAVAHTEAVRKMIAETFELSEILLPSYQQNSYPRARCEQCA